MPSEESIFLGAALAGTGFGGVGFDEAVRPAVTFRIALIPTVLLVGFEATGPVAGSLTDELGGIGMAGYVTGGTAGICMVVAEVFMFITSRRFTSS